MPRAADSAGMEELINSTERVEKDIPLTLELERALLHGSSIGGARPKALIQDQGQGKKHIAKFSSSTDLYSVVKAEFIAMKLADLAGLNVAPVKLAKAADRDVPLIERFDRQQSGGGGRAGRWSRR